MCKSKCMWDFHTRPNYWILRNSTFILCSDERLELYEYWKSRNNFFLEMSLNEIENQSLLFFKLYIHSLRHTKCFLVSVFKLWLAQLKLYISFIYVFKTYSAENFTLHSNVQCWQCPYLFVILSFSWESSNNFNNKNCILVQLYSAATHRKKNVDIFW